MSTMTESIPVAARRSRRRRAAPTVALAVLALAVSACGSSSGSASSTPSAAGTSSGGTRPRTGIPGTSGVIAAISGRTLQVQGSGQQTAVTFTARTAISDVVAATAQDVAVGLCAVVRSGTTTSATPPTAAPTTGPVTAASISLSTPVRGTCGGGFGAGFGGAGARPSPSPGRTPRSFGAGTRRGVQGRITAVHGTTLTISGPEFGRGSVAGSGSASTVTPTVNTVITTTAATTYTRTVKATAKALVKGRCVTAFGPADDTGAIRAASMTVRAPTDGSCTAFGGRAGAAGA